MEVVKEIKSSDDISSALSNVYEADDNATLPIELTNATGTYLHQLNDDCLLHIFSYDSLTLMDLCALAESCTRFNEVTQRMFSKGLRIEDREILYKHGFAYTKGYLFNYLDIERILKNFGPHLSHVSSRNDAWFGADLLIKYRDVISLKYLYLGGMECVETLSKLKLQQLQILVLKGFYLRGVPSIDAPFIPINCDSLTELKIHYSSGYISILRNTFPNLERFELRHFKNSRHRNLDNDTMSAFIGRHQRLKAIVLSARSCEFLHSIGKNCTELEKLTLNIVKYPDISFDLSHLAKLDKLSVEIPLLRERRRHIALLRAITSPRSVKISFMKNLSVDVLAALSEMDKLRKLEFKECRFGNDIPWQMLTQLRTLSVHVHPGYRSRGYFQTELFNIIRELPNLEKLNIFNNIELEEEDFIKIVDIVKDRTSALTLQCRYRSQCKGYCDKSNNLKLIRSRKSLY